MKVKKFKNTKILDKDAKCNFVTEIDFNEDTKAPINFCLLLVFHQNETVYEIIKYDGSHGFCHVHKYFEKLNVEGEECLPTQINAKSILIFKKDIQDNWEDYVTKYRRKWKI